MEEFLLVSTGKLTIVVVFCAHPLNNPLYILMQQGDYLVYRLTVIKSPNLLHSHFLTSCPILFSLPVPSLFHFLSHPLLTSCPILFSLPVPSPSHFLSHPLLFLAHFLAHYYRTKVFPQYMKVAGPDNIKALRSWIGKYTVCTLYHIYVRTLPSI